MKPYKGEKSPSQGSHSMMRNDSAFPEIIDKSLDAGANEYIIGNMVDKGTASFAPEESKSFNLDI